MIKPIGQKVRVWNGREFINGGDGFSFHDIADGNLSPCDYQHIEDLVFQQWTGLHDKNGKEVYEGDILIEESDFLKRLDPDEDESIEDIREKYGESIFWKIFMGTGTIDFNGGEYASLNSGFLAQILYVPEKEYDYKDMEHVELKYSPVGIGSEFEFTRYGTNGELQTILAEVVSNCFEFDNYKNIPKNIKKKILENLK